MFIDTSGMLCVIDDRQAHHGDAVAMYDAATHRLTHSGVLVEFIALANARRFPRNRAIAFIDALLQDEEIEIEWADEELHRRPSRCSWPDRTRSIRCATRSASS